MLNVISRVWTFYPAHCCWGARSLIPFFEGNSVDKKVKKKQILIDNVQYKFSMTEGQPWIYVRVCGPVTKALVLDVLKEAAGQAAKQGVCNLLIDARGAPGVKTTVEDYNIAYYRLKELGFRRDFKSAILVDPDDTTHHFFETCAYNAGYNWRIFSDEDLASQWLDSAEAAR